MKKINENIGGGSVFARGKKLYIKYKGKQISTGLNDSPENKNLCYKKLKDIKLKDFLGIEEEKTISIKKAYNIFTKNHLYNKLEKTVSSYNYCFGKVVKTDFDFTVENVEKYFLNFLQYDTISQNSKKIVLRHFNSFLNFSYINGLISKKINLNEKHRLNTTKKIVRTFNDLEISQILNYFDKTDKEFSLMCEFMIFSGLRIGETLELTWKQINFNSKEILLKNKISKDDENLPLSDKLIFILKQLSRRLDGKVFRWSSGSKSSLNRKLDKALLELKIEKNNRSFHNFRKTFRMKLFNAKIPLENAKELLRHKDIRTTIDNYTEFIKAELLNEINKI